MRTEYEISFQDNILSLPPFEYQPDPRGLGWEYYNNMVKYKDNIAQIDVESDQRESYSTLLEKCIRVALELQRRGLKKGDVICLCTNNHLNSVVPFISGLFLGCTLASLDPSISLTDTKHLLKQVNPKIIFISKNAEDLIEKSLSDIGIEAEIVVFGSSNKYSSFEEFLEKKEDNENFQPCEDINVDDTAIIIFSSGTTGLSKGICTSHYSLLCQSSNLNLIGYDMKIALSYASLYWISSLLTLTTTMLIGGTRLVSSFYDPKQIWYYFDKYKPTFVFLAPIQALRMLQAGRPEDINTTNVLNVVIGGGPLGENHILALKDLLPGTNVVLAYGQSEIAGLATAFKPTCREDLIMSMKKPSSCGRLVPGLSYKVVDLDSQEIVGPYKRGELHLKTKYQMVGYHNLDSSVSWDEEGWLKTGDVVYYDEDFCFYIVDRIKEMLKFQSWHVAPAFLEEVLLTHPAVELAVVVGIPHDEDGDHPMGVVILKEGENKPDEKELEEYVSDRVDDRQKLRAGVKFVDKVPMTPSGKIKRKELRDAMVKLLM